MGSTVISSYLTKPIHLTAIPTNRQYNPEDGSYTEAVRLVAEMDFGEVSFSITRVVSPENHPSVLPLSHSEIIAIARQIPTIKRLSVVGKQAIIAWVAKRVVEYEFGLKTTGL